MDRKLLEQRFEIATFSQPGDALLHAELGHPVVTLRGGLPQHIHDRRRVVFSGLRAPFARCWDARLELPQAVRTHGGGE